MRTLEALFSTAPDLGNIRGTRWAAYNAVTAMLDHHSKVTGKRDPDLVRAERALTDDHPTAKIKIRTFELLRTP
ncbi:DUF932 domain-containing protein [Actinomadura scrupuli]|uniref:DUF932 domain-containing protein n=1 Tax=Actinomadura scrupuli TaxID=559629 RepID=UPI003D951BC5